MRLTRSILIFILIIFTGMSATAQPPQISISTDVGVLRSLKEGQQFWAFGHTVQSQFHLTHKDAVYFWLSYYTNGKFTNDAVAIAKGPLVSPQFINYKNSAIMGFKQFSIGWKKYLKGTYNIESDWNLYGYAGFGLLLGSVQNRHSNTIDTLDYSVPVRSGSAKFKRLTLDLGLGGEVPLGGDLYLYVEGRSWIPTSDYPSKYVFINDSAPITAMINAGIRILF